MNTKKTVPITFRVSELFKNNVNNLAEKYSVKEAQIYRWAVELFINIEAETGDLPSMKSLPHTLSPDEMINDAQFIDILTNKIVEKIDQQRSGNEALPPMTAFSHRLDSDRIKKKAGKNAGKKAGKKSLVPKKRKNGG